MCGIDIIQVQVQVQVLFNDSLFFWEAEDIMFDVMFLVAIFVTVVNIGAQK